MILFAFMLLIILIIWLRLPDVVMYIALFGLIALILYGFFTPLFSLGVRPCPKCEGVMAESSFQVAFSGAQNIEDGTRFAPLVIKIWRCNHCQNEFWELIPLKLSQMTEVERNTLAAETYLYEYSLDQDNKFFGRKTEIPKQISVNKYNEINDYLTLIVKKQNDQSGFKEFEG